MQGELIRAVRLGKPDQFGNDLRRATAEDDGSTTILAVVTSRMIIEVLVNTNTTWAHTGDTVSFATDRDTGMAVLGEVTQTASV